VQEAKICVVDHFKQIDSGETQGSYLAALPLYGLSAMHDYRFG
jgi:hypothetical protein